MRERKAVRVGLREVRTMQPGEVLHDSLVSGFGVRRWNDSWTYFLRYRVKSAPRWFTIGKHGQPWTPETARDRARKLLGEIANGGDPAAGKVAERMAMTMSELLDEYWKAASSGRLLTRHRRPKQPSTLISDHGRIERHIRPLLGKIAVRDLAKADVEKFQHDVARGKTAKRAKTPKTRGMSNVRGGRGAAGRCVAVLGAILSYAVNQGIRPDNPVRGVIKYAEEKRDRRLSDDEYKLLGKALRQAEEQRYWPPALAAIRFLALSGWRSGEVIGLRRAELDMQRRTAVLRATKTGKSIRPLSLSLCSIIEASRAPSPAGLVFPPARGSGVMSGFRRQWCRIAKLAGLPDDITPHTLRHSFASMAGDMGYGESTIGAMIGHVGQTITSRYIHSADAVLLAAADTVAGKIAELLDSEAVPAPAVEDDKPRVRHTLHSRRPRHTLGGSVAV